KGSRSHRLAEALHIWLPNVIQAVKPWISTHSIEKGERPGEELTDTLRDTGFGIACLTPESLHAQWIHFECGAISKTSNKLWTFLLDLRPTDVTGPLSMFQHTTAGRDDVWKLLLSINTEIERASENFLSEKQLATALEKNWEDLDSVLR